MSASALRSGRLQAGRILGESYLPARQRRIDFVVGSIDGPARFALVDQ
jgi:hypothetical protein